MKFFSRTSPRGFTLIELLTVIFIIGLLSAIIVVAATSARTRSRDAKRIADLGTVSSALQQYYVDNRSYPLAGGAVGIAQYKGLGAAGLVPTYVNQLPVDPKCSDPTTCTLGYYFIGNGDLSAVPPIPPSKYYLWAVVENDNQKTATLPGVGPVYVIKNGEVWGDGIQTFNYTDIYL